MRTMHWAWCGRVGVVLGVSVGVAACGGGAASGARPTSVSSASLDDEAAADLAEHHRHHHHGGVTMFIAMSIDSLGVSPAQHAAVEKIQADLFAKMEPARTAEQNVVVTIADGIAVGGVDHAKVDVAVAQVANAAAALHDATTDSLNQLHTVLTPPQRAALVDKIAAHWDVWKRANAQPEQAGSPRRPEGDHLAMLAKELTLTADQVDKVRSAFGTAMSTAPARFDPQDIDAHLQTFATGFQSDNFDAKALAQESGANAHLAGWGASRMARFYEAVDPVLAPEQRAKLAQMLREHANHKEDSTAGG